MTIEIGTTPPAASDQASTFRQLLLDAIKRGEGGGPLLRSLLAGAKLSPDHQAIADLLIEASEQPVPEEPDSATILEEEAGEQGELRRELADLRQGNDIMAAALGACPYCWGGDPSCRVCRGRGSPGYAPPDPDLFTELVLPAARRVRDRRRAAFRSSSRRERW